MLQKSFLSHAESKQWMIDNPGKKVHSEGYFWFYEEGTFWASSNILDGIPWQSKTFKNPTPVDLALRFWIETV